MYLRQLDQSNETERQIKCESCKRRHRGYNAEGGTSSSGLLYLVNHTLGCLGTKTQSQLDILSSLPTQSNSVNWFIASLTLFPSCSPATVLVSTPNSRTLEWLSHWSVYSQTFDCELPGGMCYNNLKFDSVYHITRLVRARYDLASGSHGTPTLCPLHALRFALRLLCPHIPTPFPVWEDAASCSLSLLPLLPPLPAGLSNQTKHFWIFTSFKCRPRIYGRIWF